MTLPRLTFEGHWFKEPGGRRVLLRGVNLGGDCKVPYPDGGTNFPSDFTDHCEVSFIGRPFPLNEADAHLGRLAHWGFTCLRLLTTWEAVEHAGPGQYDEAYLDYFQEVVRKAGEHGFYVFIDFHQDVWSRMTGGDGAPGWIFDELGLDMTRFDASGAAHVMQHRYDYAQGGRQEDRYPTMSWTRNYRLPVNGIIWTLFFAGARFTPAMMVRGRNVQDFLQSHYLGAMRAVAERVAGFSHVLGFDTLNEPGSGFIGRPMSDQHMKPSNANPQPVPLGPAWSPLDALLVADGVTREIPEMGFDLEVMAMRKKGSARVNEACIRIWRDGVKCPFALAGAYAREGDKVTALDEEFFTRDVHHEADHMLPFFRRVAETIRAVNPTWMIFAEFDAFKGVRGFPPGMPPATVNASHWYDVVTLTTKTFMYPEMFDLHEGRMIEGAEAIRDMYVKQLARLKEASATLPGGAPTLVGEFGIPFDLDAGAAYAAWAAGDRGQAPWARHATALGLQLDAMDALMLHWTLWNYTATNRNDPAIGDGWNQEDLSIFSIDQHTDGKDPDSGGRALDGIVRPWVRACQGVPREMHFNRETKVFTFAFDADPNVLEPTEIFVPRRQYPRGFVIEAEGMVSRVDAQNRFARFSAREPGAKRIVIREPGHH
ncbi:MAG: cellulase family glycosylhydrolase [Alphaproteobacteria bacterium]|nr:cellulase family glycosylhydrolase [Alphaproteobacteria bacterium]